MKKLFTMGLALALCVTSFAATPIETYNLESVFNRAYDDERIKTYARRFIVSDMDRLGDSYAIELVQENDNGLNVYNIHDNGRTIYWVRATDTVIISINYKIEAAYLNIYMKD